MAIKSIVYDVDGVLVRSFEFAGILARDYGIDREMQLSFFQGPMRECVLGLADMKQAIQPFLAAWGWPTTVEDFVSQWFEADGSLNADVAETVAPLRAAGYKCCVASTQESHRAAWLEERLGFRTLFDDLFFSCRLGATKGDVRFFERATDKMGLAPQEILFFDDANVIVETARRAGWNAEVYHFGDDVRARLRDYEVLLPDA
jgi:putative hydrolase of the HAD superfamily